MENSSNALCGACLVNGGSSNDLNEEDQLLVLNNSKQKGDVITVGNENVSLQDSFKKFRNQKLKERQILKLCKAEISLGKRSDTYKDNLRLKFIEGCKKYLGVPYAERFKAPEAPIAPLYLDCCGLVRQVVKDLQEDFGFVIGKWNQCYQMDTLPIKLESHTDLKPGDLIFYEGIYNSNRSKPQKHNNVHVEVFLGGETGEETIGSRYHKGVVSIFPSYKFKSTTWDLVNYHFRSIDTWLNGECRSYCEEHQWLSDSLAIMAAAGKRSIFNDEEDDVNAGGFENDDHPEQCDKNDNVEDCIDTIVEEVSTLPLPSPTDEPILTNKISVAITISDSINSTADKILSRNENKMISSKRLQQNKVKQTLSASIDQNSIKPNSSTSRKALSNSLDCIPGNIVKGQPYTYYVAKSNGWKLVKAALDKRGWQQLPFEYQFSSRFSLKWVERRSQIDYLSHTPGQLVCHIPNNDVITTKLGLLKTMREKFTTGKVDRVNVPWLPETYLTESSSDCTALLAAEDKSISENNGIGSVWIYKPPSNNRGRGIKVFTGRDKLEEICYGKQTNNPETTVNPCKGIVQRYIQNPLLIGKEGYKFDIRCYMLIARTTPFVAFYHPGYCRLTLKPYSSDMATLDDSTIHLTNASVQKKDPLYITNKEFQIQTPEAIANILINENANHKAADFITSGQLDHEIKKCMVDVLSASSSLLSKKHGYFDLLGCDFMIDTNNQLILLEINTNPALSLDNSTLEKLLPNVVDGAIQLVLDCQGPDKGGDSSFTCSELPSRYQLIFNESDNYSYK